MKEEIVAEYLPLDIRHRISHFPECSNDAQRKSQSVAVMGSGKDKRDSEVESGSWTVCDFRSLPKWMKDNDYLLTGHRPPLPSYSACINSIFRIHTETINIWTHLLGCVMFIVLAIFFLQKPSSLQEKLVFSPFFLGAILCLGFSFAFHTVHCHSPSVVKLFGRLDYCGIAILITGSFVPWLFYGFYCHFWLKVIYMSIVLTLGFCAIFVSLSETFGEPKFRAFRAIIFIVFGLSGVFPALHCVAIEGWDIFFAHVTPLLVTACLYILGAALYAGRVPERLFPGKCDIWFQSHQIFHVLVVLATFVDYQGLKAIAHYHESTEKHCT